MKKYLIVYAKRPLPGYAKTRLGAVLGNEAAAGFYARMLYAYLINLLQNMHSLMAIELSVASEQDVEYFEKAFPELFVHPQRQGDFGQRMEASFRQAFALGADAVVLTGSDIPDLDSKFINLAFTSLENHHGVIGPASDGGYYLIGMRSPGYPIFSDIAWSTKDVFTQTEELSKVHGLTLKHLPTLADIDNIEEYETWYENLKLK